MSHATHTGTPGPAKLGELESIRGLAAMLVVFFHLPKWDPVLNIGFINNSYLMVELFFVLSGYVIFNAYQGRLHSGTDLLRFQFLRFGRLYPVHLLFLLAFVVIEAAKYVAALRYGFVGPNTQAFQINDFTAFLQNLFLISGLLPTERLTFNGPAWSICVEFYTYLLFGLIVLYAGKHKLMLFGLITAAALVLISADLTFGFDHVLQCLSGFFLGCLTAWAIRKAKFQIPGFVSLLMLVLIAAFLQAKPSKDWDLLIYPLSVLLIAALVLSSGGFTKSFLNTAPLTGLGAISYSVYMSHAAIEWAANQAVRIVLKKPEFIDGYGNSIPRLSAGEALTVTALVTLAVVITSVFVYRWVEGPLRDKSRSYAQTRWP
jgi:peptidoglycan/LPS O-acetylase OafA/YrhL